MYFMKSRSRDCALLARRFRVLVSYLFFICLNRSEKTVVFGMINIIYDGDPSLGLKMIPVILFHLTQVRKRYFPHSVDVRG